MIKHKLLSLYGQRGNYWILVRSSNCLVKGFFLFNLTKIIHRERTFIHFELVMH